MSARRPKTPASTQRAHEPWRRRSRRRAWLTWVWAVATSVLLACDASDSRRLQIEELLAEGQLEEAIPLLEEELAEDPQNPELLFRYGMAQLRLGRPSLAIWGLLEARQHPEWQTRALFALIDVGVAANDREQSVAAATELIELEPDDEDARLLRAESYIALRKFEKALEDADWLLERQPGNVAAHTIRLQGLLGLKRVAEIESDFDELERLATEDALPEAIAARYCTARATFSDENGDTELAVARFDECLEAYPLSGDVMMAAIAFFDEKGKLDRATSILSDAVEDAPNQFELREALSNRLRALGDPEAAEALLLEVTDVSGATRTRAWAALAYHYFALEDFDRSVEAWKTLFKYLSTPDEGMRFAFGEALIHAGRYDEAEEVAAGLPEMMGELVRGLSQLEQGQADQALLHFEKGQRLWPNNAVARYFAGLAAERNGDIDRAITELRQSIRIRASDTPAALRLARLLDAEGRPEEARTALSHYLKDRPQDTEGRVFSIRIAAAIRGSGVIAPAFDAMRWPRAQLGEIIATVARDATEIGDAEAAIHFLENTRHVDFASRSHAAALRAYVDALVATGRADEADALIGTTLTAHPDQVDLHEIRARWALASGQPADQVTSALERAERLDPDSPPLLATRARWLLREGRPTEARTLFERARAADATDVDSSLASARIAIDQGDLASAQAVLGALRAEHPTHAEAAALLAHVLLARGGDVDLADRLARCAIRFRGDDDVKSLLEESYREHERSDVLASLFAQTGGAPALDATASARH